MITLVTFPPGWGELSYSPFSIKAIFLMNASGLEWTRENANDPRRFPQAKLPALRVGDEVIGDSDNIRAYMAQHGTDVDAHLSQTEKAELVLWQRMSEEHLYYQAMLDRWLNPEVWPRLKANYFGFLPFPVRHILPAILRRNVRQGLEFAGHARQSPEMRMQRIEADLQAITTRLANLPFLLGERPSSADASLGAMLATMRAGPVPTELSKRVSEDSALMEYVARVHDAFGASVASV